MTFCDTYTRELSEATGYTYKINGEGTYTLDLYKGDRVWTIARGDIDAMENAVYAAWITVLAMQGAL